MLRLHASFLVLALVSSLLGAADAVTPDPANPAAVEPPPAEALKTRPTPATPPSRTTQVIFEQLTITGGPNGVQEVPGSATYLSREILEEQSYGDIHRVLRQVPGLNIQEEEGYGLRPNIGMRGTGVERSDKITIMEDGVLIAPAPYAAPAAYYFPTVGRMEGIEVRKGSTSIRQGPYTTGGALNLISSSIPSQLGGRLNIAFGEDRTRRGHLMAGDSRLRFGWMLETFQNTTDGFKKLDGGGDTGFELQDYLGKIRWNTASESSMQQMLELKLGHTTQSGDETYLGLTEQDFRLTPYRRYAGSQRDLIETEHDQIQLRHMIAPGATWDVTTSIYHNDFFRNWAKLDSVRGVGIAAVLAAPQQYSSQLDVLRGDADDQGGLSIRNNRRDYYAQGIQTVLSSRLTSGRILHGLEAGIRFHQDSEDRFQEDDKYSMMSGHMQLFRKGAPGTNANRITDAEAVAVFLQDQMSFGRWTVTPGVRVESIDFEVRDFGRNDPERSGATLNTRRNSVDEVVPGLGIAFAAGPSLSLFGGIHKGFAPPGAGASAETRAEESVNYEAGFRWRRKPLNAELIAFFNDYDNLLGRDTLATGGTGSGDLFNGGQVEVRGLEAAFDRNLTLGRNRIPLRLAYTWTQARFLNSFESSFPDWAPRVHAGDDLPYIPEHQLTLNAGFERGAFHSYAQFASVSATRTAPGRGAIPAGSGADAFLTADLTAGYELMKNLEIFVQGRNLTDQTYVVARRPAGLRPGLPRTFLTGLNWNF